MYQLGGLPEDSKDGKEQSCEQWEDRSPLEERMHPKVPHLEKCWHASVSLSPAGQEHS